MRSRAWAVGCLLPLALLAGVQDPDTIRQQAQRDLEELERPQRALKTIDGQIAAHPDDLAARTLRLPILRALDRGEEAWRDARALMGDPRARATAEAVLAAARLAVERGRADLAGPWVEEALGHAPGNPELLGLALDLAELRGQDDGDQGALAVIAAWRAADPASGIPLLRLARFHEARERWAEAAEACEAALAIAPAWPEALERRGHLLLRAGRRAQGLASFRQALEADPGRRELDRYLRYLESTGRPFYADLEVPLEKLLARGPAFAEGGPGYAFRLRLVVEHLEDDGRCARFVQEAIEVLTEAGAEALDVRPIVYGRGRQRVRLLSAAVQRAGGERRQAEGPREAWSEGAPGDPYDRLLVDLPPLRPGDVVDLRYCLTDARPSFLGEHFGRRVVFQEEAPVREAGYVLLASSARALRFNARGLNVEPQETHDADEGRVLRRWTLRDLPALVREPDMPPRHLVSPCLEISSFADWENFGRFYTGRIAPGLEPGPAIEVQARSLVGEGAERDEKIEALRRFVATRIQLDERAVFDAQGLRIRPAAEVLAQGGGDAQDRALLLVALLRAAGLEARPALVDAQPLRARTDDALPLLEHFNHCVVELGPEEGAGVGQVIDPMEVGPLADGLSAALDGARALVIAQEGPRWRDLPEGPARDRWVQEEAEVEVQADRSARARVQVLARGEYAVRLRAMGGVPAAFRVDLERLFAVHLPGAQVSDVAPAEEHAEGLQLQLELSLPRFLPRDLKGGSPPRWPVAIYAAVHGARLVERAELSRRDQELLLGPRGGFGATRRLHLGGAWDVRELPAVSQGETAFGRYRANWRREGDVLVQELEFALEARRVAASDYPAFRSFLLAADAALDQTVLLVPAGERGR